MAIFNCYFLLLIILWAESKRISGESGKSNAFYIKLKAMELKRNMHYKVIGIYPVY
jgi:hypothetical protein